MGRKKRTHQTMKAVVPSSLGAIQRISVDQLAGIPEEEIWLASRKSARTRRAYRQDVAHFMRTLNIRTPDEMRRVDHRTAMTLAFITCQQQGRQSSTVSTRLTLIHYIIASLLKFGVAVTY